MGVTNLWALLEPVGRRINVEALTSKTLAVDASIWLIQFLKAMRDDRGDPMKNAHLLGFFRRICRLLFHRIRPVFVFDGATPALKRRTVIARRRRREQHTSKLKKTAEKLLMNQLKQHALTSLIGEGAAGLKLKKRKAKKAEQGPDLKHSKNEELLKEGLLPVEDHVPRPTLGEGPSQPSGGFIPDDNDAVFDGSPEEDQHTKPSKESLEREPDDSDGESSDFALDLPDDLTTLDPEVLFTLPPSIQYDVILQMREKQFGENREKFVSLTGQPENFSDHQMAMYLKASQFRRQLEDTRKQVGLSMGINGAQAQKIASEPNRSYIFQTNLNDGRKSTEGKLNAEGVTLSAMLQLQNPTQKETPPQTSECDPSVPKQTLDITFEVPQSSSEDEIEWEDDEEDEGSHEGDADTSEPPVPKPASTITKQKFWSLSHGFKLGRSLGQWGAHEGQEGEQQQQHEGAASTEFVDDDAQLQEALRRSLEDFPGNSKTAQAPLRIIEGGNAQLRSGIKDQSPSSEEDFVLPSPGERRYSDEGPSMASPNPIQMARSVRFVDDGKAGDVQEAGNETRTEKLNIDFLDGHVNPGNLGEEAVRPDDAQEQIIGCVLVPSPSDGDGRRAEAGAPHHLPSEEDGVLAGEDSVRSFPVHVDGAEDQMCVDVHPKGHIDAGIKESEDGGKDAQNTVVDVQSFLPPSDSLTAKHDGILLGVGAPPASPGSFDMSQRGPVHVEPNSQPEGTMRNSCMPPEDVGASKASHDSYVHGNVPEEPIQVVPDSTRMGVQQSSRGQLPPSIPKPLDIVEKHGQRGETLSEELLQSGRTGHDEGVHEELEALEIEEELALLQTESQFLDEQQKRLTRHAETPTPQMYAECQELLQMFGLPYIIAPMEAEAQCAFLNEAGLVDGVVTEDNDVFLFGGRMVYKNLFENKKYVEEYNMKDIESELGLDRERLVQMAMLLGSDYTEGISGIGIVNATEVVQAFSGPDGPKAFRDWVNSPDEDLVTAARASTGEGAGVLHMANDDDLALRQFKIAHKSARKNWELPESFPNPAVVEAYVTPKVDGSKEKFTFGRPDLEMLRTFCSERFGWDNGKVDELLVPVLKVYDQRQTQLRIDSFVSFRERFAKIKSKRLQKAVAGITGTENAEIVLGQCEPPPAHATGGKKGKAKRKASPARGDDNGDDRKMGRSSDSTAQEEAPEQNGSQGIGRKENVASGVENDTGGASGRGTKRSRVGRGGKNGGIGVKKQKGNCSKAERSGSRNQEEMEVEWSGGDSDSDTQPQESVLPARQLPMRQTRLDVSYLEADESDGDENDE